VQFRPHWGLLPHLPARPLPHHQKSFKGYLRAHAYTIVARNLIRAINGGAGAHADHGRHIIYTLIEMLEGRTLDYNIEDPAKLRRVAQNIGLTVEGKEERELLKEVLEVAMSDFTKISDEPCRWLEATVTEGRMKKFTDCNIQPRSVHTTISETMGQTHMGVDADPVNLIFQGLKTALAGLYRDAYCYRSFRYSFWYAQTGYLRGELRGDRSGDGQYRFARP